MKSVLIALASAIIALSSSNATAQPFIEIDVSGTFDLGVGFQVMPFGFRAIFDAGAAPDSVDSDSVRFNTVWGESNQTKALTPISPTPFVVPLEYIPADFELTYSQSFNTYQIYTDVSEFLLIELVVREPVGAFSLAMTSLPDAPGDYHQTPNSFRSVEVYIDAGTVSWSNDLSFSGGTFVVTIKVVDDPNAPEPCIADFNGDGNLDFFDVSAYITLYSNGCP